jgi:hypothetical protein
VQGSDIATKSQSMLISNKSPLLGRLACLVRMNFELRAA